MSRTIECFVLIVLLLMTTNAVAGSTSCERSDVIGHWYVHDVDFGVSDHVEYQETIEVYYLDSIDGKDQFNVTFAGVFTISLNPWQGECIGDQYVLQGDVLSHDTIHSIQAARNAGAPNTDQCSIERCEATCMGKLADECHVSKTISTNRMTFVLLPGHAVKREGGELEFILTSLDCSAHDCNHPGSYHAHD